MKNIRPQSVVIAVAVAAEVLIAAAAYYVTKCDATIATAQLRESLAKQVIRSCEQNDYEFAMKRLCQLNGVRYDR